MPQRKFMGDGEDLRQILLDKVKNTQMGLGVGRVFLFLSAQSSSGGPISVMKSIVKTYRLYNGCFIDPRHDKLASKMKLIDVVCRYL